MSLKNFSAGPAMLPRIVLSRARGELLDFMGSGLSVAEVSHRSAEYEKVHNHTQSLFRELMAVPDTHEILLMQGGTRLHFGLLAMNLLPKPQDQADYLVTGMWSRQAYDEAARVRNVRIAADSASADGRYRSLPSAKDIDVSGDARYLHLCSNNTVMGTQWRELPDAGSVPLVVDMTSDILSRQVDWTRIGVAYAGAQKNLGPAGVVVVVFRKDLLAEVEDIPNAMNYSAHAEKNSLLYTPASFSVLTMQLLLEHAREIGGVPAIEAANKAKADLLYSTLEKHQGTFEISAAEDCRSAMNVVFSIRNDAGSDATEQFLAEAQRREMRGLKGHRSLGGLRASIYNWVPLGHVEALAELVEDFAKRATSGAGLARHGAVRQPVPLKVEYTYRGEHCSSYIKNLSTGGLRLPVELTKGETMKLRLSFLGVLAPMSLEAIVRWATPAAATDFGRAQSGLEFVDVAEEAQQWLTTLLASLSESDNAATTKVLLVEHNDFLGGVYSQEVLNWTELHGVNADVKLLSTCKSLFEHLDSNTADLIVVDLDDLDMGGAETLKTLRERLGPNFPVIFLDTRTDAASLEGTHDEAYLALSKPLDFGQLMETIRVLHVAVQENAKTRET